MADTDTDAAQPATIATRSTAAHDELRIGGSPWQRMADARFWLGWTVFGLLWTLFLVGMGWGYWERGVPVTGMALVFTGLPGLGLVYRGLAQGVNTTRVRVDDAAITVHNGPLPIQATRRLPLDSASALDVRENEYASGVTRWRTYDVVPAGGFQPIAVVEGLRQRGEADFLARWLNEAAQRRTGR